MAATGHTHLPCASLLVLVVLCSGLPFLCLGLCDVSSGRWVFNKSALPRYDGRKCTGFPCLHRTDNKFLKYQWVAPGCTIPRFDPLGFLGILRGKVIAFVGDSLSGNLANAVTCAVSSVARVQVLPELPGYTLRKITRYSVPEYNVTIMRILSGYLVGSGQASKRRFLDFNTVDPTWADFLHQTSYIVFGGMHWYMHSDFDLQWGAQPLVSKTDKDAIYAAALSLKNHIISSGYTGVPIFTTYSPTHELGVYPPACGRVNCAAFNRPLSPKLAAYTSQVSNSMTLRELQLVVFQGTQFKILDITRLSLFRPDGHSGAASGTPYKASADCSHWCVPGVPDTWADLLYAAMTNQT